MPELLDAILQVFPLDTYVDKPVNLMEVMPGDDVETPIWDTYKEIVKKYDGRGEDAIGQIERFSFYKKSICDYRHRRVGAVCQHHAAKGCSGRLNRIYPMNGGKPC